MPARRFRNGDRPAWDAWHWSLPIHLQGCHLEFGHLELVKERSGSDPGTSAAHSGLRCESKATTMAPSNVVSCARFIGQNILQVIG